MQGAGGHDCWILGEADGKLDTRTGKRKGRTSQRSMITANGTQESDLFTPLVVVEIVQASYQDCSVRN